jgi:hypothetical protein
MWWNGKQKLYCVPAFHFFLSCSLDNTWYCLQSLQHTGDVVRLELCNDFCTSNYPNPKIPRSNQGRWTYNIVSLKVSYMCMICVVRDLHTNRKRFLHLSEGGTDKHLRKILSNFSRYCSLYHCRLNSTLYVICGTVINIEGLFSHVLKTCQTLLFVSKRNSKLRKWTDRMTEMNWDLHG